jgi:quercetin dioxygenase-like cupin family protein
VTPLLHESIGDVGDADAFMSILTLNPKSSTPPHKHSGPVFAYVLEGSVENQVDPDAPKTYNTGDYWYEPALHVHRIFGNPGDTQQAKVLVFQLMPKPGLPEIARNKWVEKRDFPDMASTPSICHLLRLSANSRTIISPRSNDQQLGSDCEKGRSSSPRLL